MNEATLTGNVGSIETKEFSSGSFVVKFSLAEQYRKKNGDKWDKETRWHECQAWNSKFAKEYVGKGDQVIIHGSLEYDEFTDKNGNKVKKAYINVHTLEKGASKNNADGTNGNSATQPTNSGSAQTASAPAQSVPDTDELPF